MKLISRITFTRQLRNILLGMVGAMIGVFCANLIIAHFFGVYSGFSISDRFFNVSLIPSPPLANLTEPSTIVGVTALGLASSLIFCLGGIFIALVATNTRAWLGAGVNRHTIFAAHQTNLAFLTILMTIVTTLLIGIPAATGLTSFTGFSLMTVAYTFICYILVFELTMLGCTIFLRFPTWVALLITLGIPAIVLAYVIHSDNTIAIDMSSKTLFITLSIGLSLLASGLSWLTLARLPMRRG